MPPHTSPPTCSWITALALLSRTEPPCQTLAAGGAGGAEVEAPPQASESQPLKKNQNTSVEEQKAKQNQPSQEQTWPPQEGHRSRVEAGDTSQTQQVPQNLLLKEDPENPASSSSGLRKTQSVQSLPTSTGNRDGWNSELVSPDWCESSLDWSALSFSSHVDLLLIGCSMSVSVEAQTTCPSSTDSPSLVSSPQQSGPASTGSPLQEPPLPTARKPWSPSAPPAPRSYMSPTASSKAKMFRSVSVDDGIHLSEPPPHPPPASCSQVKETPPTPAAVVPSGAAVATPPHTAVAPVVVSLASSLIGQGTQAAPPTRALHTRVPGSSSRALPDKPSLSSFSPSRPPVACVSSVTPPPREEAGPADSGQNRFHLLTFRRFSSNISGPSPEPCGTPQKPACCLCVQMSQSVLTPAGL